MAVGVLAKIPEVFERVVEGVKSSYMLIKTVQQAKRYLRIVFGFTLLGIGIVMIATPGPGWLTILLALGVLAAEFVWARRLLERLKVQGVRLRETVFPSADRAA